MAESAEPVQLKPETALFFEGYVREAEDQMRKTQGNGNFLWSDVDPKRAVQVGKGQIVAGEWAGNGHVRAPSGMIHDVIGAAFVPGTTVSRTLALIQDYDNHKNIYNPEVIDSKLLNRDGNQFRIYLRLVKKKKMITVVLDTEHDVRYFPLAGKRWCCWSRTTRVAEVDGAGKPGEKVGAPDRGFGFVWRLYSYWRFEERGGGVYLECRAITLTRDIPLGLGWIVEPVVRSLPREALLSTLEQTRKALL